MVRHGFLDFLFLKDVPSLRFQLSQTLAAPGRSALLGSLRGHWPFDGVSARSAGSLAGLCLRDTAGSVLWPVDGAREGVNKG